MESSASELEERIRRRADYALRLCSEGIELMRSGRWWDAAEKIWGSVRTATDALSLRVTGRPLDAKPREVRWREFVRDLLVRAGLTLKEAEDLASTFVDVRDRMHGAMFYGGYYVDEAQDLAERALRYVRAVLRVAGVTSL